MSLEQAKYSQIPQDAVILDEKQALIYQTTILNKWPNQSQVLGYRYGSGILAVASMVTGIYMNNFFRGRFKLLHYGAMSSYLPISAVPATLALLSHQELVLTSVILNRDGCPICLQTRAAALQAFSGLVMPVILAPVTSLALVHRYHTYDMPYITKEPRKVFQVLAKMFKHIKGTVWGLFLAQAFIGSLVTYAEADSVIRVNLELLKTEKEAEFTNT